MALRRLILFLAVFLSAKNTAVASKQTRNTSPALPGQECPIPALKNWTAQEKWVWRQVCEGNVADFNQGDSALDPESSGWPTNRLLRSSFLETILLYEPFSTSVPDGGIHIVGALFGDSFDLSFANLGSLVWLEKSRFTDINLYLAHVKDMLVITDSTFQGTVNMNGLEVSYLFLTNCKFHGPVDIREAHLRGQLKMDGSTFMDSLNMNSIDVDRHLFLNSIVARKDINLALAKIGSNLELSGTPGSLVDLSNTSVGGLFRLGTKATTRWDPNSTLSLRNANVGSVEDKRDAWPVNLELDGFTYTLLGGRTAEAKEDVMTREVSWFEEWLAKQKNYSSQPYEQLANSFDKFGYKDKAREIRYASKERERSSASGLRWMSLFAQRVLIGYGYRLHYAIAWVVVLIGLGICCLRVSGQGPSNGMPFGIAYSIDMLLPIIKLRERHYAMDITGWAKYYFYFHKIMGYVLASFLIAWLSGFTK